MRTSYQHKQFGGISLLASVIGILVVLLLVSQLGSQPLLLVLLALLVFVAVSCSSLTVIVTPSSLVFWFGPGVLRKTIALREVEGVEPVRNPWYYGIGLRVTPRGMLYNVSGLSAVEITRRDGTRLRLGTDEPERLTAALRQALSRFE
ncbi:MAG: hypothetical protein ACNA8J_10590 [Gammaproteobacteria bacterium]